MKKSLLISSIVLLSIITIILCKKNNSNSNIEVKQTNKTQDYYPMSTTVREVDRKKDIVTVENNNGEQFQFTGVEDWQLGDICSLMLDNNGTENIYDDIIIKTIYDGRKVN